MDSQKQQAAERVKQANNILVTVSNNPSVDQLAACIGVTLALNKAGKHATAVFSGKVPPALKFLQPEKTIEKNTDSLRDFIIALDKSKADKLRYKVEDRVVKIFITPYRTSIGAKDLEFSQGDFNVDVVLAIGVHNQAELDQAITTHGRILHDATIITMNVRPGGELGGINWLEPTGSSLSELSVELINALDKTLIDGQIATAFLTGIVAETERFSNSKTSSQTMTISAELMGAGANQQLVATKLEEPAPPPPTMPIATGQDHEGEAETIPKKPEDGTLEIAHEPGETPPPLAPPEPELEVKEDAEPEPKPEPEPPEVEAPEQKIEKPTEPEKPESRYEFPPLEPEPPKAPAPQIHIDEQGAIAPAEPPAPTDEDVLPPLTHKEPPSISHHNEPLRMISAPPTLGTPLNANDERAANPDEGPGLPDLPTEELPKPASMDKPSASIAPPIMPPSNDDNSNNAPGTSFLGDQPVESKEEPILKQPAPDETLSDIERDVKSNHLSQTLIPDAFTAAPAMPAPVALPPQPAPQPAMPPQPSPTVIAPTAPPPQDSILPPLPPSPPPPAAPLFPTNPPPPSNPQPADEEFIPNMPVGSTTPVVAPEVNPPSTASGDAASNISNARDAVMQAFSGADNTAPLAPVQALNAQPVDLAGLGSGAAPAATDAPAPTADSATLLPPPVQPWQPPADNATPPAQNPDAANDSNAPPPVPPPMMPPTP